MQKAYTDFDVVKDLADYGHEIGLTSIDGTTPTNENESWEYNIQRELLLFLVRLVTGQEYLLKTRGVRGGGGGAFALG